MEYRIQRDQRLQGMSVQDKAALPLMEESIDVDFDGHYSIGLAAK